VDRSPNFWQLGDVEWLREHYVNREMGGQEIADMIGCTPDAVFYRLKRAGIPRRHNGWKVKRNPKDCERCGATFLPQGPAARFCSTTCRRRPRHCALCGDPFLTNRPHAPQSFCSDECATKSAVEKRTQYLDRKRESSPLRRRFNANGYVEVYLGARTGGRYILEHRYVMAQSIGRPPYD
jgi:predicted nucleic acid-binding Zn ribbon protein